MTRKLASEIQAEQDHGRQKYGSGPKDFAHDDLHHDDDWHKFIEDHNERGCSSTPRERRQSLVKVAGLAVSAIESFDRKKRKKRATPLCIALKGMLKGGATP